MAMLIIGKSEALDPSESRRLRWRLDKVIVDSQHVYSVAFDDLYEDLYSRLETYQTLYQSEQR
jgi:hypothetical protein